MQIKLNSERAKNKWKLSFLFGVYTVCVDRLNFNFMCVYICMYSVHTVAFIYLENKSNVTQDKTKRE